MSAAKNTAKTPGAGTVIAVWAVALACAVGARAVTTSCLWLWFAVPLGAPAVGFVHAYGLHLMISMLVPIRREFEKDGEGFFDKIGHMIGHVILGPLAVLAVGAVVHWLMGGAA